MNNWFYKLEEIKEASDFPAGCFGFCYKISNIETGQYYVGRKVLQNNIKRKIGKKEKALIEGKGRRPDFEKIKKESNWKEYWGSCKPLLEDIKKLGEDKFYREILELAFDKKRLTYLEVKHQMLHKVLEDPMSFNDNIQGRFFKTDF